MNHTEHLLLQLQLIQDKQVKLSKESKGNKKVLYKRRAEKLGKAIQLIEEIEEERGSRP